MQHRPAAVPSCSAPSRAPLVSRSAAALLAFGLCGGLFVTAARAEVKDRIAAVVNGQPITLSEVAERMQVQLAQVAATGSTGADLEKARLEWLKRGLDQLIDDRLIEAEAVQVGVDVSDDEVNKQVEALAKQNNMEMPTFREALAAQGIEFDTVKDSLRRQALQFRLLQYKVKPRKVSDEEVQSAYASQNVDPELEFKARNLFVPTPEGASAETLAIAQRKAEEALRRIARGDEFAVVARDLSTAPSAREGGDLGWLRKGTLFPEADAALAALKPGQTTRLIRISAGWHLFHLDERRPVPPKPLAEVQEEIRNRLANDSILKERENYLRSLRKTAQLDVKL